MASSEWREAVNERSELMKQDSKNYKVRCVGYKRDERYFTIGKVYDVVDGKITSNDGHIYKNWDDVIDFLSDWYKFERVVDDTPIARVIFNNPATIILWADGTKTVAKTHGDDAFDPEKGFAVACAKKLLGNGDAFRWEFAKWAPVEKAEAEPNIDGFKVGDRVVYDDYTGTVIALSENGSIGVEFDKQGIGYHNCGGVTLRAGHKGASKMCRWFGSERLKHFENRPLTEDELYAMQGKKVWLVYLDKDGKPETEAEKKKDYGGWHTVKGERLYDENDDYYDIKDIDAPFGFHAYREPPKK